MGFWSKLRESFFSTRVDQGAARTPSSRPVVSTQTTGRMSRTRDQVLVVAAPVVAPVASPPVETDVGYWWEIAPRPKPIFREFESINNPEEFARLNAKIDSGDFTMMEIPDNIVRVIQVLNKPNFVFDEVASLIQRSPVMTGEFLKVANSSLYSHGNKIHSLALALKLLGSENIKALLYMYSASHTVAHHRVLNDAAQQVVEHSKAVSLIARYLSGHLFPDPDMAFLAGLLHDIGKLALLRQIGEDYNIPQLDFTLTEEAFNEIFPPLHGKAGRLMASNWDIDENIALAIERHHTYLETPALPDDNDHFATRLCAVVELSDLMARMLGKGLFVTEGNVFESAACRYLGMERAPATIQFLAPIPKLIMSEC